MADVHGWTEHDADALDAHLSLGGLQRNKIICKNMKKYTYTQRDHNTTKEMQ